MQRPIQSIQRLLNVNESGRLLCCRRSECLGRASTQSNIVCKQYQMMLEYLKYQHVCKSTHQPQMRAFNCDHCRTRSANANRSQPQKEETETWLNAMLGINPIPPSWNAGAIIGNLCWRGGDDGEPIE